MLFVGGMFGRLIMVCGQKYDVGEMKGLAYTGVGHRVGDYEGMGIICRVFEKILTYWIVTLR